MQDNQEYIAFIGSDGKEEVIIPLERKSETLKLNLISKIRKAIQEHEKDDFEVRRNNLDGVSQIPCSGLESKISHNPDEIPMKSCVEDGYSKSEINILDDYIDLKVTSKEEMDKRRFK